MILTTLAPYFMAAAGIPLAGLTICAFGWREPGNDTRRNLSEGPALGRMAGDVAQTAPSPIHTERV